MLQKSLPHLAVALIRTPGEVAQSILQILILSNLAPVLPELKSEVSKEPKELGRRSKSGIFLGLDFNEGREFGCEGETGDGGLVYGLH